MRTSTRDYSDPAKVRLSEHFLLSDFIGCNSVYVFGHKNVFDGDESKFREGQALAQRMLEPFLERSRVSVTYGYISPSLSRLIVKYQDPDKPSYHRWDAGAACDVVPHSYLNGGVPPIYPAFWIEENLPASRIITYSESPCICVATRYEEIRSGNYRRALYENRYEGRPKAKPLYVAYSPNATKRIQQKRQAGDALKDTDWVGAGYPTYHGGGIKQAQHYRTSRFTVLSDFLYSTVATQTGKPNMPSLRMLPKFRAVGEVIDRILLDLNIHRVSVTRGYENPEWGDPDFSWRNTMRIVVAPPASLHSDDLMDVASEIPGVVEVRKAEHRRVEIEVSR